MMQNGSHLSVNLTRLVYIHHHYYHHILSSSIIHYHLVFHFSFFYYYISSQEELKAKQKEEKRLDQSTINIHIYTGENIQHKAPRATSPPPQTSPIKIARAVTNTNNNNSSSSINNASKTKK